MHRRQFLQAAAAAALAAGAMPGQRSHAAPATPGGKAPFRLWYNNDTTNVMSVVSPFHKRGEPFTDEALEGSIDEVAIYEGALSDADVQRLYIRSFAVEPAEKIAVTWGTLKQQ